MTQTLFILMMVVGYSVLVVAMAGQLVLLIVLLRESKKLDKAAAVATSFTALAAQVSALKKDVVSLDELVSTWMSRVATRSKRKREKEEEDTSGVDQDIPRDLEFPSLVNG